VAITSRIKEKILAGLKRLTPVLNQQKTRDVSEADTVTLVKDLLSDVFGYDKYADLTGEFSIRGTYCYLVAKIDNKISHIIEVKAIGVELDDRHVKQAVDYAVNQGVEWVILTNAIYWKLYHVIFSKPIDKQLVTQVDLLSVDLKQESNLELPYLFTKEGVRKGAHVDLHARQEATSRYLLAALLVNNDSVLGVIRRELRRVVDVIVSDDDILQVLKSEVIKRDCLEGQSAEIAQKSVIKREVRSLRSSSKSGLADATAANGQISEQASPEQNTETQS
jgi:predicted type IV restriction endonuclease